MKSGSQVVQVSYSTTLCLVHEERGRASPQQICAQKGLHKESTQSVEKLASVPAPTHVEAIAVRDGNFVDAFAGKLKSARMLHYPYCHIVEFRLKKEGRVEESQDVISHSVIPSVKSSEYVYSLAVRTADI